MSNISLRQLEFDGMLYVAKSGDDSTGTANRMDLPFLTIGAALSAASAGDTVLVNPGVYQENVTIPTQVVLQGVNPEWCVIQQISTISNETLVTLGSASILRDMQVSATVTVNAIVHTCIAVGGTDNQFAQIINCRTFAADAGGTSGVMALSDTSTGTADTGSYLADGCVFHGQGRRVYSKTSAGTSRVRNTLFWTTTSNGTCIEATSGTLDVNNCNMVGGRFSLNVGALGTVNISGGTFQKSNVSGTLNHFDESPGRPIITDLEAGVLSLSIVSQTAVSASVQHTFNTAQVWFTCEYTNNGLAARDITFSLFEGLSEVDTHWRYNVHAEADDDAQSFTCYWTYVNLTASDVAVLNVRAVQDTGTDVDLTLRRIMVVS